MLFGVADYSSFVIAFIVLLILPGPGNLVLILSTSKGGLRAGMAAMFGIIAGDQVLLWAAVLGLSAMMAAIPSLLQGIQLIGAIYLGWLGIQLCRAKGGDLPLIEVTPGKYFRQGLLITLLNPKAIVFYMAFFPLFIDVKHHLGMVTFTFMAITIIVIEILYGLITCSLILKFQSLLRERVSARQWLERIAGVLLLGFAIHLLVSRL